MKFNKSIANGLVLFFFICINSYAADQKLPLEDIRLMGEVFGRMKTNYVDEVDNTDLVTGCIKGMVSGIDPDSAYLTREDFNRLKFGNKKDNAGIGLNLSSEYNFIKVVTPIDGTPAYHAGIKSGDIIYEIDGVSIRGLSLSEVVSQLLGRPDTEVELKILRNGQQKPIYKTITRKIIRIVNIKHKLLDNKIAYIRISTFLNNTGKKLKQKLAELSNQAGGRLNGLVLDLRNNPGGLLNEAVAVTDIFLTSGLITYTEGRNELSELKFTAKPEVMLEGTPMVVLVNEGSAAASEIVSGALKDHRRAIIVGTRTYGRGSIQTIVPLANGGALKLTTARWRTPDGAVIHGSGIKPDIEVLADPLAVNDRQLKRALAMF